MDATSMGTDTSTDTGISASDGRISYRLEMLAISKTFPGVQALSDVTFRLLPGEVHALLGENGAGKSTLIKILSGAYPKDGGRIFLDGKEVEISNPSRALQLGIATIYQESNLALELSAAENIYMGRLPMNGRMWVNGSRLYRDAQALLDQLGTSFDARARCADLSPAQRQMVEIAKALSMSARIIVLDEPTASLTGREVDILFDIVRLLCERNVSVILVTHRLNEVFAVADRATVLRDGHYVGTHNLRDITEETLVMQMVGRHVTHLYSKEPTEPGAVVLRVEGLSGEGFEDISFEVRAGEVVGFFGLVGSGRTEVVRTLFGAERLRAGSVQVDGKRLTPRSPTDAIKAGIALVPEDRKMQGLVLGMPVRANISLASLKRLSNLGFLRSHDEAQLATEYKQTLDIRCPSVETPSQSLSGGNQQKVVIGKWLAQQPRVLILDEPTRGVDVAAKAEVHRLMGRLASEGVGVLMVSSELPEILGMSDRVLVMHEGRLAGEISRADATEERIMALATASIGTTSATAQTSHETAAHA